MYAVVSNYLRYKQTSFDCENKAQFNVVKVYGRFLNIVIDIVSYLHAQFGIGALQNQQLPEQN